MENNEKVFVNGKRNGDIVLRVLIPRFTPAKENSVYDIHKFWLYASGLRFPMRPLLLPLLTVSVIFVEENCAIEESKEKTQSFFVNDNEFTGGRRRRKLRVCQPLLTYIGRNSCPVEITFYVGYV